MAMFVLSKYVYVVIILTSVIELRVQGLNADVVYEMLDNRLKTLEAETFSMKLELNNRLNRLERIIRLQLHSGADKASEERNKELFVVKETIFNALASEKLFIRNSINQYEEQFAELQTAMISKMNEATERMHGCKRHGTVETSTCKRLDRLFDQTTRQLRNQASVIRDVGGRLASLEVKQASDLSDVEWRVGALESNYADAISKVTKRLTSLEGKTVGFTARLMKTLEHYGGNTIIAFDKVVASYLSGYNPSTGIFTAPRPGLYLFQYNVEAYGSQEVHVGLYINGVWMTSTTVGPNDDSTGSNAAIGYMFTGQQAYVSTGSDYHTYGIYPYRTSFTGVLIN